MGVEQIYHYFPHLSDEQKAQFEGLMAQYKLWNAQINVISRKDIDQLYVHHVLHSLAIANIIAFKPGSLIADVGTGGGFPGVPLAILFPECHFTLNDSIGKKLKVVEGVAEALNIQNITTIHSRFEDIPEQKFDFIVSRAVTRLKDFLPWCKGKTLHKDKHEFKNGLFYLKGGDLTEELSETEKNVQIFPIKDFFKEDFYETKAVIYCKL